MPASIGRITLWGIEVFVAAAEERSITIAATRLGASPSAVSQQLTNLEQALGTALLNRNERPMSLTPAGTLFLRRAQTVLNEAARARVELAMKHPAAMLRLRLGMIEDFEAEVTPSLLSQMAAEMPKAQFQLETGPSHRLIEKLDQRALDMVVTADMGPQGDRMEVHPIVTDPFVAVVPQGRVDVGDPLPDLRKMPLILYTERHLMGRLIAGHLARQDVRLNHRFELDSYHAIMALVAAGSGWTILTPLALRHAHRFLGDVEVLPLPFPPLSRQISLTARKRVMEDMAAQAAARLRLLVRDLIVQPTLDSHPWLSETLVINEN